MESQSSSPANISRAAILAGILFLGFIVYNIGLAVYRLYISPLAKIPGPKLAAATWWYEFYYDVIKPGQYTWKLEELHSIYGPIIRINPYEIHIRDPDFYDKLYTGTSGGRKEKWEWFTKIFDNPLSGFGTCGHELHRFRRGLLNNYFSKRAVTSLEPMIRGLIDRMIVRMRETGQGGRPFRADSAFGSLTMDVITEYSFGTSYECIESKDFHKGQDFIDGTMGLTLSSHVIKHLGWVLPIMKSIPLWVTQKLNPPMGLMLGFQNDMLDLVHRAQSGELAATSKEKTMFQELLEADIPAAEKSTQRLREEGQSVVGAGMLTTAHYLAHVSYLILANPEVAKKLKAELFEAMPDPTTVLSVVQLEQLPYLNAVYKEGHRRAYGIITRLQRIDPDKPLEYGAYSIPPGTPVSMSCKMMHDDPDIFPDPTVFRPERWLEPGSERKEKYLVNFSKGTRQCIGLNLASAEILLTLSAVFRRLDMKLYETTWEDVEYVHDYFVPVPRMSSRGVRITIE